MTTTTESPASTARRFDSFDTASQPDAGATVHTWQSNRQIERVRPLRILDGCCIGCHGQANDCCVVCWVVEERQIFRGRRGPRGPPWIFFETKRCEVSEAQTVEGSEAQTDGGKTPDEYGTS